MNPKAGTPQFKTIYLKQTPTTILQSQTEAECRPFFISIPNLPQSSKNDLIRLSLIHPESENVLVLREKHCDFVTRPLHEKSERMLPGSYLSLDASKPWILYWTLHSLDLLDRLPSEQMMKGIVYTLEACWSNVKERNKTSQQVHEKENVECNYGGGFGGGVGQMPHCATTYAAVMALCIIAGTEQDQYEESRNLALNLLQRKQNNLLKWFMTLRYETKISCGSGVMSCGYRMHHDGEVDVRATYCICAVASLLNILTDPLKDGMMEHIVSCQTYEGGFGGESGLEAHGGYTFCALSALHILMKDRGLTSFHDCGIDVDMLEDWLVKRQLGYEGGFNGRTNKLVDGCYTFWVGGAIAILDINRGLSSSHGKYDSGVYRNDLDPLHVHRMEPGENDVENDNICIDGSENDNDGNLTFDQYLLQRYVLLCAQDPNGGLRDKPSKARDFYHSCYNLSGLSVSQHVLSSQIIKSSNHDHEESEEKTSCILYQNEHGNILGATHPVYNIRIERVKSMIQSFI